jgi:hypothetical protein
MTNPRRRPGGDPFGVAALFLEYRWRLMVMTAAGEEQSLGLFSTREQAASACSRVLDEAMAAAEPRYVAAWVSGGEDAATH